MSDQDAPEPTSDEDPGHEAQSEEATRPVAGLKLWMSTDDGAEWTPVPVKRDRDGAYTAGTRYPPPRDTGGAVSLKVEAWDADGNTLKQTSTRLFDLR